jgi:hypothetical protein
MIQASDFKIFTKSSFLATLDVGSEEIGKLPSRIHDEFYLVFFEGEFLQAFPSKEAAESFIARFVEEINAAEAQARDLKAVQAAFHKQYSSERQKWSGGVRDDLLKAKKSVSKIIEIDEEEPGEDEDLDSVPKGP